MSSREFPHVLHDEGFAGSDPQGHVKLAVLHHAGGVVGGRSVDLAAPRGDVLLADAVFLKDPLAEQIGIPGGMGHGDADGHLLFLDLGEGRNAGSLVHDEVHPGGVVQVQKACVSFSMRRESWK